MGKIIKIAATLVCSSFTTGSAVLTSTEVTPELAKRAALYYFLKTCGWHCSKDFEYFRISDPKIFNSYRGDRQWYNFYFTVGADPLPTRAELADWVKTGQIEPMGGHIYFLDIAGDKDITPCSIVCSGIPSYIKQRPFVENYVKKVSGSNEINLLRVFYTTADLQGKAACFEYGAGGKRYIVTGFHLREYNPAEIPDEPRGYDVKRIKVIWEDVEERIHPDLSGRSKIYFREVDPTLLN